MTRGLFGIADQKCIDLFMHDDTDDSVKPWHRSRQAWGISRTLINLDRRERMSRVLSEQALASYSSLATVWMHYEDRARPWVEEYRSIVGLAVACIWKDDQLHVAIVDQEVIGELRVLWLVK
jgi:hypothetical protein